MSTKFRTREEFIVHIMNKGFAQAADAFSRFLDKPVIMSSTQSVLFHSHTGFSYLHQEKGSLYVLITQLIGTVTGTSYLIFSEQERGEILSAGNSWNFKDFNDQLKDALLLEIDNIISASVISELANVLHVEIYGDVPVLKKLDASELQKLIVNDSGGKEDAGLILMNTAFSIGEKEQIHPQFIWRLDSKIFEKVPESRLLIAE